MSERIATQQLAQVAAVSSAPIRTRVDRNFGLPTGLYAATVGLYLGFFAIMTATFHDPGLIIPMAIIVGFVLIAFGLAARWPAMQPDNDTRPLTWGQFSNRGIQTMTGRLTAGEASVQVLILPVLILFWGLCVATIAALT